MFDAVVVTHNTPAQAQRCLAALRWSTRPPQRLVLVATGAGDLMVGADDAATQVIALDGNPGYGQAANVGVRETRAPLVLVCNADLYPDRDALDLLVAHMQAQPDVACAGPALRNLDGSPQDAAFKFPGLGQAILDLWPAPNRLRASRWNGRLRAGNDPIEIDHPLGAFMMLRRVAFDIVDGFAPEYWMYSEEIDLCWRFKHLGWRVTHVPAARVWHAGGASVGPGEPEMLAQLYRSRIRWSRSHALGPVAALAVPAMRAGLRFRAMIPGARRAAYARARDAVAVL